MINHLKISNAYDDIIGSQYRELNLLDYAVYEHIPDTIYDAINKTIDGTQTIYNRRQRLNLVFNINGMPVADKQRLRAMKRARQHVALNPNYGQYTRIYAPFERSGVNLFGSIASFSRATVASYQDDDGIIYSVASGERRYEACKIGNGILLEMAKTNYFYPSHGSSGDTIWSVDSGSPTISWDENQETNIDGGDGVIRIHGDNNETVDVTVGGLSASTTYSFYLWARGQGQITIDFSAGILGSRSVGPTDLTMEWQRIAIEAFATDVGSSSVTIRITFNEDNSILFLSGHQLEDGHNYTSYIPTTTAAVTRNIDQAAFTIDNFNYVEGSISAWLKWPRTAEGANDHYIWSADTNFFGRIEDDEKIRFAYDATHSLGYDASSDFTPGDRVHIAWVWKDGYIAMIVNGVQVTSASDNHRIDASDNNIQLYSGTSAPGTVIDSFRVDTRYIEWRLSQADNEFDKFNDDATLELIRLCQARKFLILNDKLNPYGANPDYFDGSFKLVESGSNSDQTLVGA